MKILFVCTGNTCRSPMAEALLKKMAGSDDNISDYHISSAGIFASGGGSINSMAAKVLKEVYDIDFSEFRSRSITEEIINDSDLILTMEKAHKDYIIKKWRDSRDKVYTLCGYSEQSDGSDIQDPFGGSYETYIECAESIIKSLEKIKSMLK